MLLSNIAKGNAKTPPEIIIPEVTNTAINHAFAMSRQKEESKRENVASNLILFHDIQYVRNVNPDHLMDNRLCTPFFTAVHRFLLYLN